jgi:hypothetical protein
MVRRGVAVHNAERVSPSRRARGPDDEASVPRVEGFQAERVEAQPGPRPRRDPAGHHYSDCSAVQGRQYRSHPLKVSVGRAFQRTAVEPWQQSEQSGPGRHSEPAIAALQRRRRRQVPGVECRGYPQRADELTEAGIAGLDELGYGNSRRPGHPPRPRVAAGCEQFMRGHRKSQFPDSRLPTCCHASSSTFTDGRCVSRVPGG